MKADTHNLPDELLQRYFDGEVSPAERAEVEAHLDGDARVKLEALGELRGLFRADAESHAMPDFSATFDAIARAPSPVAPKPASAPRRRLLPLSAAGGFLAAVAALFLFLRPTVPITVQSAASVESLETQGSLASVFQVENGADHATVIWTDDSPVQQGETL